jgi:hypothetical protein
MNDTRIRKVTQKKTLDWAGATPLFRHSAAQKVRGVAPARYAGSVTVFCPRAQRELSHTRQELSRHTLRRTELGSVNVDSLHRADRTSSFPCALRKSRGEERFTPALHGALHCSLHPRAARKARQINPIEVPKTVALREGWHDVKAGATPSFAAQCVTVAVGSLPPSQELRRRVLRACIHRP